MAVVSSCRCTVYHPDDLLKEELDASQSTRSGGENERVHSAVKSFGQRDRVLSCEYRYRRTHHRVAECVGSQLGYLRG